MASLGTSSIEKFDCDPSMPNLGPRWLDWIERVNDYLNGAKITDDAQRVSILFFVGGTPLRKIHRTLLDDPVTKTTEYYKAVERLGNFFETKKNVLVNQVTFHKAAQHPNETIIQYIARLKMLAEYCEFPDLEFMLTYKVVCTCT
jgi:hypothetical protein